MFPCNSYLITNKPFVTSNYTCFQDAALRFKNNGDSLDDDDSAAVLQPARFEGVVKYCTTFQDTAENCEALL